MVIAPNQPPLLYDPRYFEFGDWAALMCEQYAAQNIQIPEQNTDWKSWAAGLLAIDIFVNQGIPSPYGFDDWKEWASALINVMNGGR